VLALRSASAMSRRRERGVLKGVSALPLAVDHVVMYALHDLL
jgi:hypothetical protein